MRAACLILLLAASTALACDLPHEHAKARAKTAPSAKAVTPTWVGPAMSGSWYNPARAGEGWTLEILEDGSAVVVWFTYAPADSENPQVWILGQGGTISGNRIHFDQVYTARGGRFGPNFDPAQVQLQNWGTLDFTFDGCNGGSMSYSGPAAYGNGSHPIARLAAIQDLDCQRASTRTASGARAASSLRQFGGAWFDPSHAGEGWVIEPLSATQAGVYWYTYTPQGEPVWLLGVGTMDGTRLRVDTQLRPVGTAFGSAFNGGAITNATWGSLEINFESCNRARVNYRSTQAGFGEGVLQAQRLTTLASGICLDQFPAARTQGSWSQAATQAVRESEVAAASDVGALYSIGGYVSRRTVQRFDAVANAWQVLPELPGGRDHALAVVDGGSLLVFGGYNLNGVGDRDSPGFRYNPATQQWTTIANVPWTVASGAARLNGFLYLGDESGDLIQIQPRDMSWRRITAMDATARDHSQVVAFAGEIWMIGGRSPETAEQNRVTIFDPVTETWRRGPPLSQARGGFAATVIDHQIHVAGGEIIYVTASEQRVTPSHEIIAAGENAWSPAPPLPTAVHGVGGASIDGKFYAVGGSINAGRGGGPGTLQVYTPNR